MSLSSWKDKTQTGNIAKIIYPIKDFYSKYIGNFWNTITRQFLSGKKKKDKGCGNKFYQRRLTNK